VPPRANSLYDDLPLNLSDLKKDKEEERIYGFFINEIVVLANRTNWTILPTLG